jgi:DNA mismatch endonuclease (patch repair protein)
MADIFTREKRSEIMSRIRSKNTQAELVVFRYLRRKGVYFQKHYSRAIGTPDVALPRKKKAVFIHGDFWHGRNRNKTVKSNSDYWHSKIAGNIIRDRKQKRLLEKEGWDVLVIWESDIKRKKTRNKVLEKLEVFLKNWRKYQ